MRSPCLFVGLTLAALTACSPDTLFHAYCSMPHREWARTDTVSFRLPPATATEQYLLDVGLRIGGRFPYQEIYLLVESRTDSLAPPRRDTLCLRLTDEAGTLQEGGLTLHQYETGALPLHLQEGQSADVRIAHLMRREVLPEVSDVGIRLRR